MKVQCAGGFVCGGGWYQVLYDLSQELNDYLAKNPSVDFEVMQVKSKFGILRFHLDHRDSKTEKMISVACQRASVTCEVSGKPFNQLNDSESDQSTKLDPLYETPAKQLIFDTKNPTISLVQR